MPKLVDLELLPARVEADAPTVKDGTWVVSGRIVFRLNGYESDPSGRPPEKFRVGAKEAGRLEVAFDNAMSADDAMKQAASQLKTMAEILLREADRILA